MNPITSKTLEKIKNAYKFEIDLSNCIGEPIIINHSLFGGLICSIDEYNFKERINKINQTIKSGKTKIHKDILNSFSNKLKEISDNLDKNRTKLLSENSSISITLKSLKISYEKNQDNLEALNIYKKITKEILDEEVDKFIKYEKLLLNYNDIIIDISKKLSLNF